LIIYFNRKQDNPEIQQNEQYEFICFIKYALYKLFTFFKLHISYQLDKGFRLVYEFAFSLWSYERVLEVFFLPI
jgi:hypothetical protein